MNNLRSIRRAKDFSQYKLARRIGLQQPTISLIENGFKNPSSETRRKIARALRCKISEVFPDEEIEHK